MEWLTKAINKVNSYDGYLLARQDIGRAVSGRKKVADAQAKFDPPKEQGAYEQLATRFDPFALSDSELATMDLDAIGHPPSRRPQRRNHHLQS
ncbi:hypothetical protein [Actinophytocola oryzae]|uniref:Uncharacterized protein n=1 Tax=Actinophytocola oryzae TaxID=502181 RepID=A0A4R7VVA5_9PSEU|nr:hypothetical protein [Actinophytocola oryzae]TDV53814.1 hypothetical protein CLV71_104282 [Actinophytocola oryzae]